MMKLRKVYEQAEEELVYSMEEELLSRS